MPNMPKRKADIKKRFRTGLFKNKSFFINFLLSYLLILTIPLVTILFSYYIAQQLIKDEIINSSSVVTEKVFSDVDQKLGSMLQTLIQISRNNSVNFLFQNHDSAIAKEPYKMFELKMYLNSMTAEEYSDVFLYHKATDTMISATQSSLNSSYYYDTSMSKKQEYSTWFERLNDRNVRTIDVIYAKDSSETIALYQSFPLNNLKEAGVTAGIILKPTVLNKLLAVSDVGNDGAILIFDKDGQQLLSTDKTYSQIVIPSDYNDDEIYINNINGHEYVMRCSTSETTSCTYAFLIPTSVFWKKLTSLNSILFFSVLLCLLLSVLLTFALARQNYRPFKAMLGFIGHKTNLRYNRTEETEAEFIRTAFEQVFVENEDLNIKLENERQNLCEEYLFKVMQGIIHDGEDINKSFSQYGITLISNLFCAAIFDVGKSEKSLTTLCRYIKLYTPNELVAMIARTSSTTVACVFNFDDKSDHQQVLTDFCKSVVSYARDNLEITISCGIGTMQQEAVGIHKTYTEALHSVTYEFVFGKGECILFPQIVDRKFCYHYDEIEKSHQILLKYIDDKDSNSSASECFDNIKRRFWGENLPTHEMVKCLKHDLTRLMDQVIGQVNATKLENERGIIDSLIETDTFAGFKERFILEIEALQDFRKNSRGYGELINRAIGYIQDNKTDINLNVNTLGEGLQISPSYLSKLFRDATGMGVYDYIVGVRIAMAKQLLLQTGSNIDEIAKQSGFLDSSALVRAFKKNEGITPGSFRKLNKATTENILKL